MIARHHAIRIAVVAVLTLTSALAQAPLFEKPSRSASRPPSVEYLYPGQLTLRAGKPAKVALHFRVAPGLHINSHTPSAEELIPTTLTIPNGSGVRLDSAVYPAGTDFALPIDPKTKLNVYTGEFVIQARIVATAGNHQVEAQLRYQACDQNTCMPPRTITAAIDVIGN